MEWRLKVVQPKVYLTQTSRVRKFYAILYTQKTGYFYTTPKVYRDSLHGHDRICTLGLAYTKYIEVLLALASIYSLQFSELASKYDCSRWFLPRTQTYQNLYSLTQ